MFLLFEKVKADGIFNCRFCLWEFLCTMSSVTKIINDLYMSNMTLLNSVEEDL